MAVSSKSNSGTFTWLGILLFVVLATCAFLFLKKNNILSRQNVHEHTENLVKVVCVRCENDPEEKKYCEKCGQTGFIWVDPEKVDLSTLELAP